MATNTLNVRNTDNNNKKSNINIIREMAGHAACRRWCCPVKPQSGECLWVRTSFASLPNYYLIAIKKTHAIPHKIILLLFENMTMCVLHFIYVHYELKRCKGS